jgi:hypothetical protein
VRLAYFESERRELVQMNYAEPVQSPLRAPHPDALGYSHYFAELIDAWAADADPDERLFRLGTSVLEALTQGTSVEPLARYFECWLLRLQGVYPVEMALSPLAAAFVDGTRHVAPANVVSLAASTGVLRELERAHRGIIAAHLEKDLKSVKVMNELRRNA